METKRFNIFLLKYLLAEGIKKYSALTGEMYTTAAPENANKFFSLIQANNLQSYLKFGEETCRVDWCLGTNMTTFYIFFRNKKNPRPDLGPRRYDFCAPSSVEVGTVNTNGAYVSMFKKHYSDFYGNDDLIGIDDADGLSILKTIEYEIINSMIDLMNQNKKVQLPLRPIINGRADFKKKNK